MGCKIVVVQCIILWGGQFDTAPSGSFGSEEIDTSSAKLVLFFELAVQYFGSEKYDAFLKKSLWYLWFKLFVKVNTRSKECDLVHTGRVTTVLKNLIDANYIKCEFYFKPLNKAILLYFIKLMSSVVIRPIWQH